MEVQHTDKVKGPDGKMIAAESLQLSDVISVMDFCDELESKSVIVTKATIYNSIKEDKLDAVVIAGKKMIVKNDKYRAYKPSYRRSVERM